MPLADSLVEQLVDDDKVVTDRLLLDSLNVDGEDLDQAMEEKDDLCRVRVTFGEG